VFRACVLAVYHLARPAQASKTALIFLTPLSFGAAHLHHAWDVYNRFGRTTTAMKRAVLVVRESTSSPKFLPLLKSSALSQSSSSPTPPCSGFTVPSFSSGLAHSGHPSYLTFGVISWVFLSFPGNYNASRHTNGVSFPSYLSLSRHRATFAGIIAAYMLGIAGYVYAMRYWTVTPGSMYWYGEGAYAIYSGPLVKGTPS
jgi:prenyl protein peptidase